eukprot:scaffold467357_cov33-Prasinocladus_malaysianus.AAC.1
MKIRAPSHYLFERPRAEGADVGQAGQAGVDGREAHRGMPALATHGLYEYSCNIRMDPPHVRPPAAFTPSDKA